MMKTKHTPGPWNVREYDTPNEYNQPDLSNYQITAANKSDICVLWPIEKPIPDHVNKNALQFDYEETNSNARLIATAPELLEYAVADLMYENTGSFTHKGESIKGKEAQLRLRIMRGEAIKKATT